MRSLEILTQRIFNNLIKENQKLESDHCSKTVNNSVQCPEPRVQSVASIVQIPVSRVQCPESSVQLPESSVQNPASRVQRPGSSVQSPVSRVQRPESSIQSAASRVLHPNLASSVQEFWYAHFYYLLFNTYPL